MLQRSIKAWANILESFGITPDTNKIKNYLKKEYGIGKRKVQLHNDTIFNIREVVRAISRSEDPKLKDFLRLGQKRKEN